MHSGNRMKTLLVGNWKLKTRLAVLEHIQNQGYYYYLPTLPTHAPFRPPNYCRLYTGVPRPARLLQKCGRPQKIIIFFLATARDENTTAATTSTCFVNNIFPCNPNIERRLKVRSQYYFKKTFLKRTFNIRCWRQEMLVDRH